jgi:hypothetical protein
MSEGARRLAILVGGLGLVVWLSMDTGLPGGQRGKLAAPGGQETPQTALFDKSQGYLNKEGLTHSVGWIISNPSTCHRYPRASPWYSALGVIR